MLRETRVGLHGRFSHRATNYGADIAQRPAVIDVPHEKGHVILFSPNPVWRGETQGSYFLVFNAILNFDNLDAGRKYDDR